MVFIRQKSTWFATGKYIGEYKTLETKKTIPNTACIFVQQYASQYFWASSKNARKQLSVLKKNDQVLAWGEIKYRKTNAYPLFVITAIMKAPVPNVSLKTDSGLDIEYAKYLEQMSNASDEINFDDFKVNDT